MPLLELRGCTAEPLGAYLKALGVLRLVSEQADARARGWWDGSRFSLQSRLDEEGLVRFFADDYRPTPIVAPWNAASGFYPGDRRDGIDAIATSTSPRFAPYRSAIEAIRGFPELPSPDLQIAEMLDRAERAAKKPKDQEVPQAVRDALGRLGRLPLLEQTAAEFEEWSHQFPKKSKEGRDAGAALKAVKKLVTRVKKTGGGTKAEIVRACRNRLGDAAVEWLDAAVVTLGTEDLAYPPVLGTGGNEGHLDYTNNFMCRIAELLLKSETPAYQLLRNALFSQPSGDFASGKAGQFDPGRAGGSNQGPGVEHGTLTNPWGSIITLEGAVAWAGGISRRQRVGAPRLATSPFTVQPSAAGYGSSATKDDESTRAEIWTPLWRKPAGYGEIRALLREGRADIGRRIARSGLEFAEAAAGLGVNRGVNEFVRYSLVKRRGDSFVALPAGRFLVKNASEPQLFDDLGPLFGHLDWLRRRDQSNTRTETARRALEEAMFGYLARLQPEAGGNPIEFRSVVSALGRLEQVLQFNHASVALRQEWLEAGDCGLEFRIAAALASIWRTGEVKGIREYLRHDAREFAWMGNTLWRRMASVLQRRLMDGGRTNARMNPLEGAVRIRSEDVQGIITGELDSRLLEDLIFGLVQVRWWPVEAPLRRLQARWAERSTQEFPAVMSRAYTLLKQVFLTAPLREVMVHADPTIVPLLLAGRLPDACEIARRRLRAAGLSVVETVFESGENTERLAAALLVPVWSPESLLRLILRCEDRAESASI